MASSERTFIEHAERLDGFAVEAVDGSVGRIAKADEHKIAVQVGRIRRRILVLPARVIGSIDLDDWKVRLNRTRRQIRKVPQPSLKGKAALGGWFDSIGQGYPAPPIIPGPPAAGDNEVEGPT